MNNQMGSFQTDSVVVQSMVKPFNDRLTLAHIHRRAEQLELTRELSIERGVTGVNLRSKAPEPSIEARSFAQELALLTCSPVSLSSSRNTIRTFYPIKASFIPPDWISDGYNSSKLVEDTARLLLMRLINLSNSVATNCLSPASLKPVSDLLSKIRIPHKLEQVGQSLSLELDCTWQTLGKRSFGELVCVINATVKHPELVQIVIAPCADTILKGLREHLAQVGAPQLALGVIRIEPSERTIKLPLADTEDESRVARFLMNLAGWSVRRAEPLKIADTHTVILSASPLPTQARDLTPPTAKDLNQIKWVIPKWMMNQEPKTLDRYVLVECRVLPPLSYLEQLRDRLERTGIPIVLTIAPQRPHGNPQLPQGQAQPLQLQELELSDLIKYSIPPECHIRKIQLKPNQPLLISLYAAADKIPAISELQVTLSMLLKGAVIYSLRERELCKIPVSSVKLEIQSPSARLAGLLRRVGPVFQDFIARVAEVDGRVKLEQLDEKSLINEFNQASSPWTGSPLPVPTNGEWLNHTGQTPKLIDDRASYAIDVAGTQFCEDAFSAQLLGNGNFEVKAHIARVSRWVLPGSKLDADASSRRLAIYPPRGGHTLPLLPRELLLERVGYNRHFYRPSWSITMELSPDGEFISSKIEPTDVRVTNFLSFKDASALLSSHHCPSSLKMLSTIVERAFAGRSPNNRGPVDAGDMVEALLTLSERAIEEHFFQHDLRVIARRISGAGRDYRRLLMQYGLEQTFGFTRGVSESYSRLIISKITEEENSGFVQIRRLGSQMMSEIQLLRAHLNDRRFGTIKAPGGVGNRNHGDQPGAIAVQLDAPFITDYDCVLDPTVTAGYSSDSVRFKTPLSEDLRHIYFGERVTFAITGIDLVAGKLTVKPVL